MRGESRIGKSHTVPNLPTVAEDDESGNGPSSFQLPPAPPPSPEFLYRELEQLGIPVPRDRDHGRSRALLSSQATFVSEHSISPYLESTIDHQGGNYNAQLIAAMSSLDPQTAPFEPADAWAQPMNQFGAANHSQFINEQYANGGPTAMAENGNVNGSQHFQHQFQEQVQQQPMGNATFVASPPQAMHTFPTQLPTANMHQQDQALMPTFPNGSNYQTQTIQQSLQGQNQNEFNMQSLQIVTMSPQGGGEYGTDRFTPVSYRFTPQSSYATIATQSPTTTIHSSRPPSTEPRNFAPRTSGLTPAEPPPKFALHVPNNVQQAPVPMEDPYSMQTQFQQNQGGVVLSSQRGVGGHTFPTSQATTQVPVLESTSYDNGFDPFRIVELSNIIQPIEPISNALVAQNHTIPQQTRTVRSQQLNDLTSGPKARPTVEMALHPDYFPFCEGPRNARPSPNWGVVKIKNIPFNINRAEILAFFGRNSRVLNDRQEPVHIIMERVTSRTQDCYVEFMSMQDAITAVDKHNRAQSMGRSNRLGERPVEIEVSSQAAMMKDLFPHAKGVRWEGSRPVILEDHPTEPWSCFKGFITVEEMVCLIKHVEVPQRSPFSKDGPQRPYESMISTLRKFPWYMTEHITLRQRQAIFKAVLAMLEKLQAVMRTHKGHPQLNQQLYKRLYTSAMLCDGLTVCQKDGVAYVVGLTDHEAVRDFNLPRFADMWTCQYIMVPKPGTPLDLIEWYIALIREETERRLANTLPHIQDAIREESKDVSLYWGYLYKELNFPKSPAFDDLKLAEVAHYEFSAVTDIVRRALADALFRRAFAGAQ